MNAWLGIDVGQAKLDVALVVEGSAAQHGQFDNTQVGFKALRQWLKRQQVKAGHACLEATGRYGEAIAEALYEWGYTVSVVNPARIKGYAQSRLSRNKTDKLDAALLADFCRTQQPDAWTPPAPEYRQLQHLVRHLEDLEQMRQQARNRLHAAAKDAPLVHAQLQAHLDLLEAQIKQLKVALQDHIDQHPHLKQHRDLLDSIPGIGSLTAAKLLAEFHDLRAFDDVRQVVAFAGLNPMHHQSGSSIRSPTHISKQGRSSIRAALYMPAVSAKSHNRVLKAFAQRLLDRGLKPLQVVVAVMRKLLHLAYGVLKSGQPFDPLWNSHLPKQA